MWSEQAARLGLFAAGLLRCFFIPILGSNPTTCPDRSDEVIAAPLSTCIARKSLINGLPGRNDHGAG